MLAAHVFLPLTEFFLFSTNLPVLKGLPFVVVKCIEISLEFFIFSSNSRDDFPMWNEQEKIKETIKSDHLMSDLGLAELRTG